VVRIAFSFPAAPVEDLREPGNSEYLVNMFYSKSILGVSNGLSESVSTSVHPNVKGFCQNTPLKKIVLYSFMLSITHAS